MILTVLGRNENRLIRLSPNFFTDSIVRRGDKRIVITPAEKATQLGKDIFGKNYQGHTLEMDGETISNVMENRDSERPKGRVGAFSNTHASLSSGLK